MILKKTIVLSLLSVFIFSIHSAIAQEKVYQLSSHILDITAGQPASGVDIVYINSIKRENGLL